MEGESLASTRHGEETIGYVAVEAGTGMWGSVLFEAIRTAPVVDNNGARINFSQNFGVVPNVITTVSSYVGVDTISHRHAMPGDRGMKIFVEEDTTLDSEIIHSAESISYLAMGGSGLLMGDPAGSPIGEVGQVVGLTDQGQVVQLDHSYLQPVVFAQSPTANGADPIAVRVTDVQSDRFTVYLQEPSNANGTHGGETVSYLVVESGNWLLPGGTMLEVGAIDTTATTGRQVVGSQFESISFSTLFSLDPVIFSQVQTANDNSFVKTRQDGATNTGFQLAMDVEQAATSPHGQETIGYLAIDEGSRSWGPIEYEARTSSAVFTHSENTLSFDQGFVEAPLLLSNLATYNGADPSALRYDDLDNDSVRLWVEEDTTADAEISHSSAEAVSILAFAGEGVLYGTSLTGQVLGETGIITNVTDQSQTILLNRSYVDPVVFAQPASSNGGDPVVVRVTDIQSDRFEIRLQEPSNLNGTHGDETVSYVVLEAGQWELSDGTLLEVGTVDTINSVGA